MAGFKEIRLRLEGGADGVDWTPETLPMSRLAEYLTDLAQMMGSKDAVHLITVAEGSAMPVLKIEAEEESRISTRLQEAQRGVARHEANLAYKRFDDRLREDNAVAEIINVERMANIIVFPGRRQSLPQTYPAVREPGQLTGELKRVGGLDETVPVTLKRSDGQVLYCETDQGIAREMGQHLYKTLRVFGSGTWHRNNEGVWKLEKFRIHSYALIELPKESFSETLTKLRAVPGNEWVHMADPLLAARKIREGEESEPA